MLKTFSCSDGTFMVIEYRMGKEGLEEVGAALGYMRVEEATAALNGEHLTYRVA